MNRNMITTFDVSSRQATWFSNCRPSGRANLIVAICLAIAFTSSSLDIAAREPSQKWAVLVGVDDYALLNRLEFAGADQRALAEQLVKAGFPQDQVFLLCDKAREQSTSRFAKTFSASSIWS